MAQITSRARIALIAAMAAAASCHRGELPVSVVTIGANELSSAPMLHTVPIVSLRDDSGGIAERVSLPREAAFGPRGEIVLVASSDSQLVVFDSSGQVIRSVGRNAGGPRLGVPVRASWAGPDSLLVVDAMSLGIKVLDSNYRTVAAVAPASPTVRALPLTLAADSTLLLLARQNAALPARLPAAVRGGFSLVRMNPKGDADSVAQVAGDESYLLSTDPNREPALYEFGRATVVTPWNGQLVIADNAATAIDIRDGHGRLVKRIIPALPPRLVTPTMRDTARALERHRAQVAAAPSEAVRNDWLNRIDSMRFADTLPTYEAMVAGRDGSLWVERFLAPGDSARDYLRFDSSGKLTGRLAVGPGFVLIAADRTRILLRSNLPESVNRLALWALTPKATFHPTRGVLHPPTAAAHAALGA